MREKLLMLRIETKLDKLFSSKVDMKDVKFDPADEKYKDNLHSRMLAALAVQMCSGVDDSIATDSITDGYNDLSIDAVYKDAEQQKLVLVQSKWRKSGTGGCESDEILSLVRGVDRIVNMDLRGANKKLASKQNDVESAIKDINYKVEVVFCHTGSQKSTEYVMKPMKDLLARFADQPEALLSYREIQINDIYEYLAKGQAGAEIVIDDVCVRNWGMIEAPFKAYYGVVSASAIGLWYSEYGNRLFNKNIRFYKGDTEVNRGMTIGLTIEPENFFYYNNGIKLLCKKITRKTINGTSNELGIFHLKGVSLVNGAQTAGSIGGVYSQDPTAVSKANVLIQMIELGDENDAKATQITRLTNTQNRIEGKDFVALDQQQERIRKELRFDGIDYIYKSGACVVGRDDQIGLDEAIVAQACASNDLSNVYLAKQRVGALTEDITKPPYKVLFNNSTNSRELVNNIYVLRMVESFISQNQKTEDVFRKNSLIHGNRVILHWVMSEVKKKCANYETEIINVGEMKSTVEALCQKCIDKMICVLSEKFPQMPPLIVFKNPARTKMVITLLDTYEPPSFVAVQELLNI